MSVEPIDDGQRGSLVRRARVGAAFFAHEVLALDERLTRAEAARDELLATLCVEQANRRRLEMDLTAKLAEAEKERDSLRAQRTKEANRANEAQAEASESWRKCDDLTARAEKAERERDEARARALRWEQRCEDEDIVAQRDAALADKSKLVQRVNNLERGQQTLRAALEEIDACAMGRTDYATVCALRVIAARALAHGGAKDNAP